MEPLKVDLLFVRPRKNFKIKTEVSCIILICDIVHYMQPHPLPSYPQNYLVLLSTYKLNTFENI